MQLVFIMQLGFALLTVGCVGAKSAKSVSLKNIMDAAAGGVGKSCTFADQQHHAQCTATCEGLQIYQPGVDGATPQAISSSVMALRTGTTLTLI